MADEFLPKSYFASSLSMLSTIFLNAELISSLEFDDFLFCAESKFIQPKKQAFKAFARAASFKLGYKSLVSRLR